jgi:hypothetical protein
MSLPLVTLISPPLGGLLLAGAAVLTGWRRASPGTDAAPSTVPDL